MRRNNTASGYTPSNSEIDCAVVIDALLNISLAKFSAFHNCCCVRNGKDKNTANYSLLHRIRIEGKPQQEYSIEAESNFELRVLDDTWTRKQNKK